MLMAAAHQPDLQWMPMAIGNWLLVITDEVGGQGKM